jgi:hypothetical protein
VAAPQASAASESVSRDKESRAPAANGVGLMGGEILCRLGMNVYVHQADSRGEASPSRTEVTRTKSKDLIDK